MITNTSPSRQKINELSQKFSNLQVNEEKTLKKELFEYRLKLLDEKVSKQSQLDFAKIKTLQDQITQLSGTLDQEIFSRDDNNQQFRSNDTKQLENYIQKDVQRGRQTVKENDQKLMNQADERSYQVKLELTKMKKQREDQEESQQTQFANKIGELQEGLAMEKRDRESETQELIQEFGQQILWLQENLTKEKKEREQVQGQMFGMLEEMNSYLNGQLLDEKCKRENTESTLLGLLEETCKRVGQQLKK